ncbi:hypothetical protein L6164_029190 [Bauhinia variegata]|uniref:Uncharacterized protein n=1 Tax=Bauhinia variegata TaxID=167791 RepID=A0ACB9L8F5_BAUVA|nr:hypothetical protein L6164_029190 [Bauhinia variegata]
MELEISICFHGKKWPPGWVFALDSRLPWSGMNLRAGHTDALVLSLEFPMGPLGCCTTFWRLYQRLCLRYDFAKLEMGLQVG